MEIVKIISEWKRTVKDLKKGKKMVEAIVKIDGVLQTRHIAINK